MYALKIVAGFAVAALVGAGALWLSRRKKKRRAKELRPETPSKPTRPTDPREAYEPRSRFMGTDEIPDTLSNVVHEKFPDSCPRDVAAIDNVAQQDLIVFGVESEPVGNHDQTREELISAKALSVEATYVRARVQAPVAYAEHLGAHAGHGVRVGDLIEVPRSAILLAARSAEPERTVYDSKFERLPVGIDPVRGPPQ